MKFIPVLVLGVSLLTACGGSQEPAQKPTSDKVAVPQEDPAKAELSAVEKMLNAKHPDLAVAPHRVSKVPETGLFEIVTADGVAYTDKSGDWFATGVLYFGKGHVPKALASEGVDPSGILPFTRRPAMQMLMASLTNGKSGASGAEVEPDVSKLLNGDMTGRQMFDALPLSAGFSTKIGAGTQKLVIFEDPDCPFCQAFHKELADARAAGRLNDLDVELVTFPYVLSDRHPNGLLRARTIACAADPSDSWRKWMLAAAIEPKNESGVKDLDALWARWSPINANKGGDCARASLVDAWQSAGRQMQFMATPTFLFSDGTTFEGQLSVSDLKEMLAVAAKNRAAQPENAGGPLGSGSQVSAQAAKALQDLSETALSEANAPAGQRVSDSNP